MLPGVYAGHSVCALRFSFKIDSSEAYRREIAIHFCKLSTNYLPRKSIRGETSIGAPPLNTELHGHTLCMPLSVFVLMDARNTQRGRGRQCVTVNTLTRGSN